MNFTISIQSDGYGLEYLIESVGNGQIPGIKRMDYCNGETGLWSSIVSQPEPILHHLEDDYDEIVVLTPPSPMTSQEEANRILAQIDEVRTGERSAVVLPSKDWRLDVLRARKKKPEVGFEKIAQDFSNIKWGDLKPGPHPSENKAHCEVCNSETDIKWFEIGFISEHFPHHQCKMPELKAFLCEPCASYRLRAEEYVFANIRVNFIPYEHPVLGVFFSKQEQTPPNDAIGEQEFHSSVTSLLRACGINITDDAVSSIVNTIANLGYKQNVE